MVEYSNLHYKQFLIRTEAFAIMVTSCLEKIVYIYP